MGKTIKRDVTVTVSLESLLSVLGMDEKDGRAESVDKLRTAGLDIVRPVGVYIPFQPEPTDGGILINGVRFGEPFVYDMLSGSPKVVPYVTTSGAEIDEWVKQFSDPFERHVAEKLSELCLFKMLDELHGEVKQKYFDTSKNISALNPGSLKEWPRTGQIPLFAALGSVTEDIGVSLSGALWMSPEKSVSGILFQSDAAYENCQLCPRPECPNRRSEYIG